MKKQKLKGVRKTVSTTRLPQVHPYGHTVHIYFDISKFEVIGYESVDGWSYPLYPEDIIYVTSTQTPMTMERIKQYVLYRYREYIEENGIIDNFDNWYDGIKEVFA